MSVLKQESLKADAGVFSEISFVKAGQLVADAKADHQEDMLKHLIESMINRLKANDLSSRKRKELVNGAIYLVQMIHQQSVQMDTEDLDKFVDGLSGTKVNHAASSVVHSEVAKEIEQDMFNLRHHFSKICRKHMTREIVSSFIKDVTNICAKLDSANRNEISECDIEHHRKRICDYYLNAIKNSLDKSLKALESTSPHLLHGNTNIASAKKELMSLQDNVTKEIESLRKPHKTAH